MRTLVCWVKSRTAGQKMLSLFLVTVLIASLAITLFRDQKTSAQVDTFNSSGTWQAPAGITSITVEAWGGGGAGGAANGNPSTGGGGAGGSYAIKVIAVTPSNNYTVTVGTGGTGGAGVGGAGGDSWFSSSGTILAKGGAGGTNGASNSTNGAGGTGSCTGCIGDTTYAGGNGGTGNFTSGVDGSGAGGGAAGNTGAGGNASVNTAGTGTGEGASGAAGVGNSTPGDVGGVPGGGGSGGKANNNPDRSGGSGGDGRVKITYNATATSVTLVAPANAAANVSLTPIFTLRAADPEADYLRYKIEVCSTSNCSAIVRTIDQTSSQTGWSGQDTQGGTAYVGSSVIGSSTLATHTYQLPKLDYSTQYWWRAYAFDPGGFNVESNASSINSFTTMAAPTFTQIMGGTEIRGGTHISN
jgi:hypothetical protein